MLIATIVCLVWGAYWMLPYNYQDLSQYAIATNLFANNILMSIKSADYWNTLNDYKPLMHTWYLGIIVQFYIILALLLILAKKVLKSHKNITIHLVEILSVISLILYLTPSFSITEKFYFLPFRIFEFGAGMWMALYIKDKPLKLFNNSTAMTITSSIGYIFLLIILFFNYELISSTTKLLITVFLTSCILVTLPHATENMNMIFSNKFLSMIGKWSFSIYIWHQIILAFCRYSFTSEITGHTLIIIFAITIILSISSYYLIEQKVSKILTKENGIKKVLAPTLTALAAVLSVSFYLNSRSGVIRDVPELDTYTNSAYSRMHIAYNENAHRFDKDFSSTDKLHWLVVGDSYGRDFTNILNESNISDKVEISYMTNTNDVIKDKVERLIKADLIFCTMTVTPGTRTADKLTHVLDSLGLNQEKLIIVGSKLFGYSCGQIYSHRHDPDYYNLSLEIKDIYFSKNKEYKERWGDNYIDMITPVSVGNNKVKVFSDNNKIISQDCEHLTKGGDNTMPNY